MRYQVLNIHKVPGTEPPEYELFVKDIKNTMHGYIGTTKYGTEEAVRKALARGGMSAQEIDDVFRRAKPSGLVSQPRSLGPISAKHGRGTDSGSAESRRHAMKSVRNGADTIGVFGLSF
jgi:hypothetical protein